MKFQIRDNHHGLCFIEADSADEALHIFLDGMLRGMAKVLEGPPDAVVHAENGRPADLTFAGETFTAVPA